MSRNRIFYPVLGVFVGPSPATGAHMSSGNSGVNLVSQLQRVQSENDSWSVTRTDINQFGQLAAISREIIEQPQSSADFSWYVADVSNERKLGLYVSGDSSAIKSLLDKTQDEKNYFIAIAPEGQDLYNYTGQSQVRQVTNGFLASYRAEGAVGGIPTASVTVEGLNWAVSTGSIEQDLKAVNPVDGSVVAGRKYTLPVGTSGSAGSVAALRPGDITVSIGSAALGINISDLKIQSYSVNFDLTRQNLQKLGNRFAFSKEIQFPVTVSASIVAALGDMQTGDLSQILCSDVAYDLDITLRDPACVGSGPVAARYIMKSMKIDGEQLGANIGDLTSNITINYSTQLGGPGDSTIGFFLSGKAG
jgi:hypothetical protein